MKETELAKVVIDHFSDDLHDIYPEVPCAGIIDIVMLHGPTVIAIECKMTFGIDVIEQAHKNRSYSHYSYVACPPRRGSMHFIEKLCEQLGIGVLIVREEKSYAARPKPSTYVIQERVKPKLNRNPLKPKLHEWMKKSVAGSQNERNTSFKEFVDSVHKRLQRAGKEGVPAQLLYNDTYRHYDRLEYFKRNLMNYIKSGVVKNVRYEKGVFYYQ